MASNNSTPSMGLYRGRQPDPRLQGTTDLIPVSPIEPHERTADGCPGGWYRGPWVDSVAQYTRRRVDGGARVQNHLLDGASWQVQEAVRYLEHEQERWQSWRAELIAAKAEKRRKAAEKRGKRGARR